MGENRILEGKELVLEPEVNLHWLKPFIRAKFYDQCQCGSAKYANYFCSECRGSPFCEKCKNMTRKHDGHDDNVLRVYRASHQPGIGILSIKKLLDVSDIQPYVINSSRIVFISQRRGKEKNKSKAAAGEINRIGGNKCEICGWPNLSSAARFCSIECKEKWSRKDPKNVGCSKEENSTTEKPLQKEEEYVAPKGSFRKRPRKGVPLRSPLL